MATTRRGEPGWLSWSRQWWLDAVIGVGVTLLTLAGSYAEVHPRQSYGTIHPAAHPSLLAYALVGVPALALAWRRRWPLGVFVVAVAGVAAWAALGYVDGASGVVVAAALYGLASRRSRPVTVGAGVLGLVVLSVAGGAGGPFGWFGGPNVVLPPFLLAAAALGGYTGARRQWADASAARVERDREDEARHRVDAERLRIARELHDVVAHTMATINVQASAAAHLLAGAAGAGGPEDEVAATAVQAIRQASKEGLRELRAILNVLRTVDEEESWHNPAPGLAQLGLLVDATTQAGLAAQVEVTGEESKVPASLELAAYRIAQESLTNALRHSGATTAIVRLRWMPISLVVEVVDPGGGSARTTPFDEGAGTGITGMRERAVALGGTLEAGATPGGGWAVRAVLPITADRGTEAEPAATGDGPVSPGWPVAVGRK